MRYFFFGSMLLLSGIVLAGMVWATTWHTVIVDGSFANYSADEKTVGDPLGDWLFGAENDLSSLLVTWDAQKLYLGFDFKAENTAVMYLLETGQSGGVSSFCGGAGYTGEFPANVQGPEFDLLLAFFAEPDHGKAVSLGLYALSGNASTPILPGASGVELAVSEVVSASGRDGRAEAGIPWEVIYGLGPGTVPSGATLRIAGVIRGSKDNDGLGDVSPNPTGAVNTAPCPAAGTLLDAFFEVSLDQNGDGVPEANWSPGLNIPHPDGGMTPDLTPPPPDQGPPVDQQLPLVDQAPTPDQPLVVDHGPAPDQNQTSKDAVSFSDAAPADEGVHAEAGAKDLRPGHDLNRADQGSPRPGLQEEGCACRAAAGNTPLPAPLLLLGLVFWLGRRRRSI